MKYETVISAEYGSKLKIKDFIKYKDLVFLFVKRDFVVKYKQTILDYNAAMEGLTTLI